MKQKPVDSPAGCSVGHDKSEAWLTSLKDVKLYNDRHIARVCECMCCVTACLLVCYG